MQNLVRYLKEIAGEENVTTNQSLKNYTTFRQETIAKILIEVYNKRVLIEVLDFLTTNNIKYVVLGGGSNVIFSKNNINKVVIHLNNSTTKICKDKNGRYKLYAFSGCKVASIIAKCRKREFSCLEWAIGIPASVGGATVMNMGAFGFEFSNFVESVTYYQKGKVRTIRNKNTLFGYRKSMFLDSNCVVLSVVLCLTKKDSKTIERDLTRFSRQKRTMQPLGCASFGSVFKNGETYKVAKLIQDCNLKGCFFGGAMVSLKHSNFIINNGNAKADDVVHLIRHIKEVVYLKYKIKLDEEVVII